MSNQKDHIVAQNVEGGIMQNNKTIKILSAAIGMLLAIVLFENGTIQRQAMTLADQQQTLHECVGMVATVNIVPDITFDPQHRGLRFTTDDPLLNLPLQSN